MTKKILKYQICPKCKGEGLLPNGLFAPWRDCPVCEGTGKFVTEELVTKSLVIQI